LSFLSFDFNIGTVIHALSSKKIFAEESFSIASPICAKSELSKFHLEILYIGTHETSDIILSTIDSTLISNESIATDFFCSSAIFVSTFKANAVFHIEGLAARIINSPGLNPVSISSI
jgi:hypothetical protein